MIKRGVGLVAALHTIEVDVLGTIVRAALIGVREQRARVRRAHVGIAAAVAFAGIGIGVVRIAVQMLFEVIPQAIVVGVGDAHVVVAVAHSRIGLARIDRAVQVGVLGAVAHAAAIRVAFDRVGLGRALVGVRDAVT